MLISFVGELMLVGTVYESGWLPLRNSRARQPRGFSRAVSVLWGRGWLFPLLLLSV